MRKALLFLTVALGATVLANAAEPQGASRVPVYLFAAENPGGFEDAQSKNRAEALKNIRENLGKKSKVIALVESAEQARVTVEIVGVQGFDGGERTKTTEGFSSTHSETSKVVLPGVVARLTAGEYSTEIVGTSDAGQIFRQLKTASGKVSKSIEEWVATNQAKLLATK